MNDEGIGGRGLIDWVIGAREVKYYIFRILSFFNLFLT